MIENRGDSFSARDLFRVINPATPGVSADEVFSPEELKNNVSLSDSLADAGDMVDKRGGQEYKKRLGTLAVEIADAQRCNDTEEVSRLELEKQDIIDQISSTHTKKGKSRKMLDSHKRTVDAIAVCIRRALKEISESDPHLAAHLSDREILKFGPVNSYTGDGSMIWVTVSANSVPRLDLVTT